MAHDLAATPRSGIAVQLCGDAHLSNFGVFGSPERRLVFSVNDFDETFPGPWEWDIKRLAASFAVAGRSNGYSRRERRAVLLQLVGGYRNAMNTFAGMANLAVWYATVDMDALLRRVVDDLGSGLHKRLAAGLDRARARDSVRALGKLTRLVDGQRRIVSEPPLIQPVEEILEGMELTKILEWLQTGLGDYRQSLPNDRRRLLENYELAHVARKVVGVGSVGTRAWIALFFGRDQDDPLFLQIKEAQASVLEGMLGANPHATNGERVVHGQRLMQAESDIFLGWSSAPAIDSGEPRDYYVRQLHDWKGSATVETMRPSGLARYGLLCGWTLARAHARSGDRVAIASYLGRGDGFDRAVAEFAEVYADQNERDYEALRQAEKSGRIVAQHGV